MKREVESVLGRRRDRAAVDVLEQHLRAQDVTEGCDQAARAEALARRLAQLCLQRHGPAQGGQLAGHEPLVDDVGDVDEADVAAEDDQRQLVGAAGRHEQVGRRVGRLEADPGGARAGDGRHPRLDLGRRHARDADPGGEQKLPAAQHLAHGRRLEHVHPLDPV